MSIKIYSLAAGLIFAGVCAAKEHSDYQKGTLLRMDSTSCGMQEKGSKTVAGELLGTDGQSKKTQEVLCQEYVLQTDRVVYRIRPESDDKEREYIVVSMTPRQDAPPQVANKN